MATDSNRFTKPVAFNRTKTDDQKILKYVARRNFSGFAKTAMLEKIERDERAKSEKRMMKSMHVEPTEEVEVVEELEVVELTTSERLEQMKKEIKKTDTNAGPKMFF